ncbi:MAG: 6-phosphofructokinase [Spirochaetes bacterium]|nr:6-phosphofructokinase [Spirochaetota bacterium]
MKGNCIIAQSGGSTAVMNASACGIIQEAIEQQAITNVYAAQNGILGILREEIFDLQNESSKAIEGLKTTPAAAFGSCRYKINLENDLAKIINTFEKYKIHFFFYIGGNDSQDSANKINQFAKQKGYPLITMGIPKTIDNDLVHTDHTPGYGSVIKYLATMTMEAGMDTEALYTTDTINIIETMGRNSGWIAAGTALARRNKKDAPHIILFPEQPFREEKFYEKIDCTLKKWGRCVIVVSEGIKNSDGNYLFEQNDKINRDTFGHSQLGGAATYIKKIIEKEIKQKVRYSIPSTIQRNGIHFASLTDSNEAYLLGQTAIKLAIAGINGKMVTLKRISNYPYKCKTDIVDLSLVANRVKSFPQEWITPDGFFVTRNFYQYTRPLIQGEVKPRLKGGLPVFMRFRKEKVKSTTLTL